MTDKNTEIFPGEGYVRSQLARLKGGPFGLILYLREKDPVRYRQALEGYRQEDPAGAGEVERTLTLYDFYADRLARRLPTPPIGM